MKYKIGDKVKVKDSLTSGIIYYSEYAIEPMLKFKGKVVTISEACDGWYRIYEDENTYYWTYEMFEGDTYENIVEYFAKMGNSAEEIQRTYERYLWHIEKFEGLENKNKELEEEMLDLSNTISELELVREELKDRVAFLEKSLIELLKEKYNIER